MPMTPPKPLPLTDEELIRVRALLDQDKFVRQFWASVRTWVIAAAAVVAGITVGFEALAGVAMMPFGRFADHVATTQARLLVIRYGGADALRAVPLADFERDLAAMVALAQAAGKRVLLVGVIATATGETDDFDLAVERTADARGTGFVDVRAVPYTLPDDLADAVHPAQAWSDRITAAIAQALGT